jgi:NAD binding domain of 6-phosphogluconate dehydrogenase
VFRQHFPVKVTGGLQSTSLMLSEGLPQGGIWVGHGVLSSLAVRVVKRNREERAMQAGFLGVGNMGLPMAGKLLDGGHSLTVYDINEAAMRPLLQR